MADNYLEKKMEDFHARIAAKKAKEERARQLAYKKRIAAYRKKLEEQAASRTAGAVAAEVASAATDEASSANAAGATDSDKL